MLPTKFNISPKKKKAIRNIAWAVCGKIVNLASMLVVGIIVARYLGKEQYGVMNYVISFVAIFQVFADFGLDFIQIREESKLPAERNKIIGTTFAIKLMAATATLIAIAAVTCTMVAEAQLRLYIGIYACSILLNTTWVTRNHFTAIVWNEYVVKTEISRNIIGLVVKLALVMLHLPLVWFIGALLFDSLLLATGYVFSYSKKIGQVRAWSFDVQLARYMVRQSFPLLLSGAAIIVYNRIDQLLIDSMIDHSHLGLYSVAVKFTEILVFIPTIISQTLHPMLVEIRQQDLLRYEQTSQTFISVTVYLCIAMAVTTSLLSYPIVYFTFGKTYIGAASVLAVLAFKVIGDGLSQTSGQLIIIEGRQKYAVVRNILGCIACILLNLWLINRYGIHGAAYTALVTIGISGTLANALIPPYQAIFHKQMKALFTGWRDIAHIKQLL